MIKIKDEKTKESLGIETLDAVNGVITEITIKENGNVVVKVEENFEEDSIPLDEYEKEINDLKSQIERLKEMYQLEHLKVLKLKSERSKGISSDSHHPQDNTYADDWRRP